MEVYKLNPTQERRFNDLLSQSHKKVYNLAYRLSNNRQDAEDLTQEAFLRAYRSFDSYEGDKPFENWIMRIVTRLFLDLKRSRSRRVQTLSYDAPRHSDAADGPIAVDVADPKNNIQEALIESSLSEPLEKALRDLKPDQRELVLMAAVQEMPYAEIAEASGVPIGTVRSRLHRAHKKLRELIVLNKACPGTAKSPCSRLCACALSA